MGFGPLGTSGGGHEESRQITRLIEHVQKFWTDFEVHVPDLRVERGAHEEVIHDPAAHPDRLASPMEEDTSNVHGDRQRKADNHADRHERTKVVDDVGQVKETGQVEGGGGRESGVKAREGVTPVRECLVVEGRDGQACQHRRVGESSRDPGVRQYELAWRLTLLHLSWHDERESELEDHETAVHLPCERSRKRVL
jgi:hypothetical protein